MSTSLKVASNVRDGKQHNERCKNCKTNLKKLFTSLFGHTECNWNLNLPARLSDYSHTPVFEALTNIHEALQKHRGFEIFVKSKMMSPVDFYIPNKKLIIEFDESQHFTKPREVTLSMYPADKDFGYSIKKWQTLCQVISKRDNNPPYRDEQRAWYDVLRDFAPQVREEGEIIRLYSKDYVWCELNAFNEADLRKFEKLVYKIEC